MSQDFPNFDESPGGDDVRTALLNLRTRTNSLQSTFSGTSFPTPVEGQLCFRTDEDKLYACTATGPSVWGNIPVGTVTIAQGGTGSTTASGARTALGLGDASTLNLADAAQAQAGVNSSTLMTPQRTAQAIDALAAKVRVSSNDTTAKYLLASFVAGNGVTLTEQNDGSNETIRIDASGSETGDISYSFRSAKDGWVLADGRTIGSSASNATNRANSDTEALFTILWSLDSSLFPIYDSTGSLTTRGANAAADFTANKAIVLPDERGRTSIGRDNMGGVTAGRITVGGAGFDGTILGNIGGSQTHSLSADQNGPHNHTVSGVVSSITTGDQNGGIGVRFVSTTTGTTSTSGSGSPHNNTQPSSVKNVFIKL